MCIMRTAALRHVNSKSRALGQGRARATADPCFLRSWKLAGAGYASAGRLSHCAKGAVARWRMLSARRAALRVSGGCRHTLASAQSTRAGRSAAATSAQNFKKEKHMFRSLLSRKSQSQAVSDALAGHTCLGARPCRGRARAAAPRRRRTAAPALRLPPLGAARAALARPVPCARQHLSRSCYICASNYYLSATLTKPARANAQTWTRDAGDAERTARHLSSKKLMSPTEQRRHAALPVTLRSKKRMRSRWQRPL